MDILLSHVKKNDLGFGDLDPISKLQIFRGPLVIASTSRCYMHQTGI